MAGEQKEKDQTESIDKDTVTMMIGVLCTSTYSMRPHRTSIDYIMLSTAQKRETLKQTEHDVLAIIMHTVVLRKVANIISGIDNNSRS